MKPDRTVSVEELAQSLWEARMPADPANQIAVCVSKIRGRFQRTGTVGDLILTQPPGYLLSTDEAELDTQRVQALKAEADAYASAGESAEAVSCLERALAQWRGPLLAGITRQAWRAEARVWEETQVALQVKKAELQLALGQYEPVIAELSAFLPEHPFFERPRAQLMTALYRSGRQADALRLYRDTSRLLDEALAIAPGAELQRLHQEILKGALPPGPEAVRTELSAAPPPSPQPAPESAAPPSAAPAGPCLLPSDIGEFVGREREMSDLVEFLRPAGRNVPLVELVGAGGTGKTTLAIHVGHQQRVKFPDGQLYIDLRGLDRNPVRPEEALARFLREMGVPASDIPDGLDQRAEKFRALLTDKRVLIILDNASETTGIRPLLPGTDTCAVIVTSRSRVASAFSTRVVELGGLSTEQALELLHRGAGRERSAAEQDAARRLVAYCGNLPLAVGILGARLAAKPHWTMARVAARLADERRRLDELEHDNLAVRTTLELSYDGISPGAQLLLRRLSVLAVPDFADWLARHLVDLGGSAAENAENLVEELVDARLVEVRGRDVAGQLRYRLHDLVRLFGLERADGAESPSQRRTAVRRTALAALTGADAAHRAVCGGDYTAVRSGAASRARAGHSPPHEDADPLHWYEAERTTLTTLVRQAAGYGLDDIAWDLAAVCRCLFSTRGHHDEWLATHQDALAAVRAVGSGKGEAALLLGLGDLYIDKREYTRAAGLLERACATFTAAGEDYGAVLALRRAACVDRIQGRYERALERWRDCLPVLAAHGDLQARVQVLRWLGLTLLELRDLEGAESYLRQAEEAARGLLGRAAGQVRLALADLLRARHRPAEAEAEYIAGRERAQALGDVSGIGYAHFGLGVIALESGRHAEGRRLLGVCRESARSVGDPLLEALGMVGLSAALGHDGRTQEAERLLTGAAAIYHGLGTPVRYARCLYAHAELLDRRGDAGAEAAALRARAAAALAGTGSALASDALGPATGPYCPAVL
ncbi:BTAD domain-containing putative transcriptional regulator [Streptomyces sp. NPDC003703]|uniref:AfsR/SARP family transcriptional regulator n=1 Tax=Streptomyces sp. NPDC003283 TaxID=3364681 RepID=UPI0036D0157C